MRPRAGLLLLAERSPAPRAQGKDTGDRDQEQECLDRSRAAVRRDAEYPFNEVHAPSLPVTVRCGESIDPWRQSAKEIPTLPAPPEFGTPPKVRAPRRCCSCHVTCERDETGWWVASVLELRGCHTQGRTVDEARRHVVEAMALVIDESRAYTTLRKKADREDRRAAAAARPAPRRFLGSRRPGYSDNSETPVMLPIVLKSMSDM